MLYFELTGTPYEIGFAHGKELKHLIPAGIKMCCRFHQLEHQSKLKELTARYLARHAEALPHMVEELKGVADAAGVPFDEIAAMSLRAYNNVVSELPEMAEDCYSLAVIESDRGPLHGGALECVPWMYAVVTVRPSNGYPFIHIPWAGTQWGVRGMNEHGFTIGQASIRRGPPVRSDAPKLEATKPLLLCYWVFRECLQRCRTTAEALEFIKQYDFASNVVFADAEGDLAAVEAVPGKKVIRRPGHERAVYCTSAFASEEMVSALECAGFDHKNQPMYPGAMERFQRFGQKVRETNGTFSYDWIAAVLRSHDGTPGTEFCNAGNVCSTIAVPRERKLYVVEGFPCQNEFIPHSIG